MRSSSSPVGAHVEIIAPITISPTDTPEQAASRLPRTPVIRPTRIRINGTDVGLVKTGSVEINHGMDDDCTSVTLTVYAKKLEIKAEIDGQPAPKQTPGWELDGQVQGQLDIALAARDARTAEALRRGSAERAALDSALRANGGEKL